MVLIKIVNLEDLLRLVLINEECGNPKDGRELTKNVSQKNKPGILQACRCPLCDKCYKPEYIFNKHLEYFCDKCYKPEYIFNKHLEYCESVKCDFSCGSINNLKEMQLFSD